MNNGQAPMHQDVTGLSLAVIGSLIGAVFSALNLFPVDLMGKALSIALTGLLTGVIGLLVQRVGKNLLKRMDRRHLLPSILKDPDEKQ